MKDGAGECLSLGDDCAGGALPVPGSGVLMGARPAVDQLVCPRGTASLGLRARRAKLGGPPVSHQLGQLERAPPRRLLLSLPPSRRFGGKRWESATSWFFLAKVGNTTPEKAYR